MKSESGSALQKATFIVLLFIAGCLAYLVMREFSRSEQRAVEAREAAAANASAKANQPPPVDEPIATPAKPTYAPLRPRVETNLVRVVTNRVPVVLRTNFPVVTASETVPAPIGGGAYGQAPVPVAYTSGVTPGTPDAAIFGRAMLRGTPPAEIPIRLDAACGRINPAPMTTRHYLVGPDGGLPNVFVYIKTGAPKAGHQESVPVLDNVGCEFQPYVLGIRAGQPFTLRNSDPVLHNFHIMPKPRSGNREMNIGMPLRNISVSKVLETAEVFVKVKCDVHPWMFAYLGVVDHPWFAVTDQNGNFTLPLALPAGQYTLAAVHVKAGELSQPITVGDGNVQPVSFAFEVPKPLASTP